MTGTISDPARMQELRDELEKIGIVLPDDVDDDSLVRTLLCACKTARATRRMLAAEQAAEGRARNPDSPDAGDSMDDDLSPDDVYRMTHQFSQFSAEVGGRRRRRAVNRLDDGEVAKRLVDRQEKFLASPNFHKPAY